MIEYERKVYPEIDVVTTPSGKDVAMVHVNNCTSEINAWESLFEEVLGLFGKTPSRGEIFQKLFEVSSESDENVGGLFACNFLSGEPTVKVKDGKPMLARSAEGKLNIANLMQAQVYSAVASLSIGMELLKDEDVKVDRVMGHGGYFKTPKIGQTAMSCALNAPVTVLDSAGEGGAFGIALLALYSVRKDKKVSLEDYLDEYFEKEAKTTIMASKEEKDKFAAFMNNYVKGLEVERKASEIM